MFGGQGVERRQDRAVVVQLVGARDPLAYDLRPRAVAQTGWRIVNLLTSVAVESAERATALKWGNIVGVPAAFCALGLVRWRLRRRLARRTTLGRRRPA